MDAKIREQLLAEREELRLLNRRGFTFTVRGRERRRFPLFFLQHDKEYRFEVKEPVGGCLMAMAEQWVEIDIDSRLLGAEDSVSECNAIIARHAWRCYRVLALAILNERCTDAVAVLRTQRILERTLSPSQLSKLLSRVLLLGDLQSFLNAIRLMSKSRLTMPDGIAEDTKAWSASGEGSERYAATTATT